jgi:site-specific recombinase XerD
LWTWALDEGLVKEQIVRKVEPPRPEKRDIQPYSEADIRLLLGSLNQSRIYTRPGKRASSHSLQNVERNRAMILILLDTGLRASELCDLHIHQAQVRNRHLIVFGKGSKERILPFCARTGQALWKYLSTRGEAELDEYLFLTGPGAPFNRDTLRHLLVRIGERAGLLDVNIHRFRHTFAINYLRNGGDPSPSSAFLATLPWRWSRLIS